MASFNWNKKSILITGGTGSFGQKCTEILLSKYGPQRLVIYSRDELKQEQMRRKFETEPHSENLRFFLGDVRDKERLKRALYGVDIVIHAAALKQVPAAEYNPNEAILTNIIGSRNVLEAAIDTGVERTLALSTDKAVNPINLYGATKLVAEKLFVQGNSYVGDRISKFSCVRYGNVIGSRGSVIPLFKSQSKSGKITITDKDMTRFWISLDQGVKFVLDRIEQMLGGEIFIPKIPSMKILDLADAIAPDCDKEIINIRPGEKISEILISKEESINTIEYDDMYLIQPLFPWWSGDRWPKGKSVPKFFEYRSDNNSWWMETDELRNLV